MFLFRTVFWLGLVILLLPTNKSEQQNIVGTAKVAVNDLSNFCTRNPNVCANGKAAFDVFVAKAQFGAKMVMDLVERDGDIQPASFEPNGNSHGQIQKSRSIGFEQPNTERHYRPVPTAKLQRHVKSSQVTAPKTVAQLGKPVARRRAVHKTTEQPRKIIGHKNLWINTVKQPAPTSRNTLTANDLEPAWVGPEA